MIDRAQAAYFADLILIKHDGTEICRSRKMYQQPAQAKSMRTRWLQQTPRLMSGRGWWSQFENLRVDVYAITPNGYEDI